MVGIHFNNISLNNVKKSLEFNWYKYNRFITFLIIFPYLVWKIWSSDLIPRGKNEKYAQQLAMKKRTR